MKMLNLSEVKHGRRLVGPLMPGIDLISSVGNTCKKLSIQMACFSVWGAVTSFTIGTYDPTQQVFVTHCETAAREIVFCSGTVSIRGKQPSVDATIALSDDHGNITGGHLFSETIVLTGEIDIQEFIGRPYERVYDANSGRYGWTPQKD